MAATCVVLLALLLFQDPVPAPAPDPAPAPPPPPVGVPAASDWASCGNDCLLFSAGDVNGDGFADLFTINASRDLWIAESVNGWKSAGWHVIASGIPDDVSSIVVADHRPEVPGNELALVRPSQADVYARFDGSKFAEITQVPLPLAATPPALPDFPTEPPPYEPASPVVTRFGGDLNGDGVLDVLTVFRCALPHAHYVIRSQLGPNPASQDQDADGLVDADELTLQTNPFDRDTDDDGLLDGWEVHGLPRGIQLGPRVKFCGVAPAGPTADDTLSPRRQDVLCTLSYYDGVDAKAMDGELARVQQLYRALATTNPDGTKGIAVHFRIEPDFIPKEKQNLGWPEQGNERFPARERGFMHWMQVTPWGGGQAQQTGDMGGCGNGWAVFAHEFGHQLSLSHEGDSEAAWCPLYPSLMNYAFSYSLGGDGNAIRFSDGRFRSIVLDEKQLSERLPFPYADLKYLETHPFRFTLEDDGAGGTRIDWNQNGRFDDGTVAADVNYGGSTNAGPRREHEAIGLGPSLAYVNGVCHFVCVDPTRDHTWIKTYQGNETWSEKRVVPNSATESDPVVVGGKDWGFLFHRHLYGWRVTRFAADKLEGPIEVPDLPRREFGAALVGDRVLIVARADDDTLEARWFTWGDKPAVSAAQKLETRSLVTPGLAQDPKDGSVKLVTSMHNSRGGIFAMRVTSCVVNGDKLWEKETVWTRGEGSGNGCCSRPVVAFTDAGQLTIFHTGGPDAAGQMIAYRTQKVENAKLDEGWLTCMMYDIWTRTRVPVAFANGPQGAIYAYRWDSGGPHNNWVATAHDGFGIEPRPMRDFDDGAKISLWGIRHSILWMRKE